jgi:predicted O-linked N-acetylglucosamine transferase (SPINDLY family)
MAGRLIATATKNVSAQMSQSTVPAQDQLQTLWQHARDQQNKGNWIEAIQGYLLLLQWMPQSWAACYNLGIAFQQIGRLEEAKSAYQRTVTLNPQLAQAHNNLGNVLQSLDDRNGAEAAYRKALSLNADLPEANYSLGLIEQANSHFTESVRYLQRAAELSPKNTDAWSNLWANLYLLKRTEEAFQVFARWEAECPPSIKLVTAGLIVSRLTANVPAEQKYLATISEWPFERYSPLELVPILGNLQYFDLPGETFLSCYRRFNYAMQRQRLTRVQPLPKRGAGKIRIGYMSPDFRRHVMGRIMLEVMRAHDRNQFDLYLISQCESHYHDEVTDQFRAIATGFADISKLKDRPAAQVIAEADLDILVDLAGHTVDNRPGVYAHRPARHIVTHLGYHGCLGLDAVEYKFTDRFADTEESVRHQLERAMVLDTCLMPFSHVSPAVDAPGRDEIRRSLGVENRFLFATFVNTIKLSPRCLATWRRVLESAPSAMLAFSPIREDDRPAILRILSSAGIDASRAVFIPAKGDDAQLRARYLAVDAALDTFPYAGGDTTMAALDMNVPVVTLSGTRAAERIGLSILSHLGVTDTVANNEDEFVAIAVRLASNRGYTTALGEKIAVAKQSSSFADVAAHTASLESAYRKIVGVDQSSESPLSAQEFYARYKSALARHRDATDDAARDVVDKEYDELMQLQPGFAPLCHARGMLAQARGLAAKAIEYLDKAIEYAPDDENARTALAAFCLEQELGGKAIDVLHPAIAESANHKAWLLLTRAYLSERRWSEALSAGERTIGLSSSDPGSTFAYGLALSQCGRVADALEMFNRTLALDDRNVDAAYNAALLMLERGDVSTADALFRRAISNDPRHELSHWRLGELLLMQGKWFDFIQSSKAFVKACPGSLKARFRLAQSQRYQGKLELESDQLRKLAIDILSVDDDAAVEELLRAMLDLVPHLDFNSDLLQQMILRSIQATLRLFGRTNAALPRGAPAKLRIGYLMHRRSATPAAGLIGRLIALHDPSRFETFVYELGVGEEESRQQFSATGKQYRQLQGLTEEAVTAAIREDGLDILVDTTELRDEKSSAVIASQPARVSVQMPLAPALPCKVTTLRLTSLDQEIESATEMLPASPLRMRAPILALIMATPGSIEVQRAQLGIAPNSFALGVFSNPELMSIRCVSAWRSILEQVPSAQLVLIPGASGRQDACRDLLISAGIHPSRIVFPPAPAFSDETSLGGVLDAVLDTFPSGDGLSIMCAAVSGLPAVTQVGQLPNERVGAALLRALDADELIAASGAEYSEIVVKLSSQPEWRNEMGERLRQAAGMVQKNPGVLMKDYEDALSRSLEDVLVSGKAADA